MSMIRWRRMIVGSSVVANVPSAFSCSGINNAVLAIVVEPQRQPLLAVERARLGLAQPGGEVVRAVVVDRPHHVRAVVRARRVVVAAVGAEVEGEALGHPG